MSNFINFHVLISHSPACLNRDDMNMQKDAVFGGKRRVRISSQSLKHAFRKSEYYALHFGESSIRTRQLALLAEELGSILEVYDDEEKSWINKTIQVFVSQAANASDDDDTDSADDLDEGTVPSKKVAVAPWSVSEFKVMHALVKKIYTMPLTDKEIEQLQKLILKEQSRKPAKNKPRKSADEIKDDFLLKKISSAIKDDAAALIKACGNTIDIALSGRMATSGLMSTIDGAMSIAHAITTHTVDSDIDWFTAVDDLQPLGSGHLDTQEFSAGVFYRYASLNLAQLQENLGGVERSKALEVAAHLAHLLATETPNAKQRTFAAFNPADLVMVNFSDVPVSLANAFESPIEAKQKGFLKPSVDAFTTYWARVAAGYGLTGAAAQFSLVENATPDGVQTKASLQELKSWIKNNGED